MNGSPSTITAAPREPARLAWGQVVAILVAATALGLVYNVASPLGVRAPKTTPSSATAHASDNAQAVQAVAADTNLAANTTAQIQLPPPGGSGDAIRWSEVKPLLATGRIVLLDARAKTAYDIEHIPGALSLSAKADPAEFIAFALNHPQDTAIVTYCGSDDCDLSKELAEKLRNEFGFTNVREMPGGIVEWRVAEGRTAPAGAK